jgi:hypothetical protein
VSYNAAPNNTYTSRSGSISIGNASLSVTQAGLVCQYNLSPQYQTVTAAGSTFSVSVTTGSGCQWAASDGDSWVTLGSSGGTGSGSVSFTVAPNAGGARSSNAQIAGQNFLITQDTPKTGCSVTASASPSNFPASGGPGTINVQAAGDCQWAIQTPSWITLTGTSPGLGNGAVGFTVDANTGPQRNGTVFVGNQMVIISQDAGIGPPPPCSITLAPASNTTVPSAGTTANFTVTTGSNCPWTATSSGSWISITSGASSIGNGTVGYSVASNPTTQTRSGSIAVGMGTFAITQAASACSYTFTPQSFSVPAGGDNPSLSVATPCSWTPTTTAFWIRINNFNATSVSFTVDPNQTTNSRSDYLHINDQSILVSQDGAACNFTVTPLSAGFTAGGGPGQAVVQTGGTCAWTALSPVLWIGSFTVNGIMGSAGTGTGTLGYFVAPNPSPQARTANLTVAGKTIPVTQDGVGIVLKSVVNGVEAN